MWSATIEKTDNVKPIVENENRIVKEAGNDSYDPAVVEVLLPLKLYEMTIKHRVLAELGELSHFILSVMSKHELTIYDIEEVTGLSEMQINPVVDRLKALDLIGNAEGDLSNSGKRIAYILGNIHNKQLPLYIDQNISVRGLFDLVSDINFDSPHNYHYEMFNNGTALQEIMARLASMDNIHNIYIAAHGSEDGLFGSNEQEEILLLK
jgi:hypothetical protein